jgi:hypothetical protein
MTRNHVFNHVRPPHAPSASCCCWYSRQRGAGTTAHETFFCSPSAPRAALARTCNTPAARQRASLRRTRQRAARSAQLQKLALTRQRDARRTAARARARRNGRAGGCRVIASLPTQSHLPSVSWGARNAAAPRTRDGCTGCGGGTAREKAAQAAGARVRRRAESLMRRCAWPARRRASGARPRPAALSPGRLVPPKELSKMAAPRRRTATCTPGAASRFSCCSAAAPRRPRTWCVLHS